MEYFHPKREQKNLSNAQLRGMTFLTWDFRPLGRYLRGLPMDRHPETAESFGEGYERQGET